MPEAVSSAVPISISPITDKPVSSVALLREKGSQTIRELFDQMQEQVVNLDEGIAEKATSFYVAYRAEKNFAEVHKCLGFITPPIGTFVQKKKEWRSHHTAGKLRQPTLGSLYDNAPNGAAIDDTIVFNKHNAKRQRRLIHQ